MSFLINPYLFTAPVTNDWAFRDSALTDSALTTYTFSNRAIGSNASAGRLVVVAVGWRSNATTGRSLSSATIGGIGATIIDQLNTGAANPGAAIIAAVVPTGTTATVAITMSGGCTSCHVGIYSGTPASTTRLDVGKNSIIGAQTITVLDVDVGVGGALFASAAGGNQNITFSYTGVDAIVRDSFASPSAGRYASGSVVTTTENAITNDVTASSAPNNNNWAFVVASWV